MNLLLKYFPVLFVFVAFAPYLSMGLGLKYEDLLIYPMVTLVLLVALTSKKIRINKSVLGLFVVWSFLLAYLVFRTLLGGGSIGIQAFLADINNMLQPFAVLLMFLVVTRTNSKEDSLRLLKVAGKMLILLLTLNTVWIITGFALDTTSINIHFWGGEESTADKAAQNNRFSGIFNQPIEAGMAYSLGLLVWLYLADKRFIGLGLKSITALLLLFVGGSLSVSKVFVLLGVGLFFVGVLFNERVSKRIIPIALLFTGIGYPLFKYLTETWNGLNYLTRLFDVSNYQSQGFLNMITAGRYGKEDSQQSNFFREIWENAPMIGKGMGSQAIYDSAHFYFFSMGGLFGLLGYICLILVFGWMTYEFLVYDRFTSEFKLFLGLVILVVASGLGAPALTLNRSSLLAWTFIGLLLQYLCAVKMIRAGRLEEKSEAGSAKRKKRRFKRYRLTW